MKRLFIILIISSFFQSCSSNDEHIQSLFINDKELLIEFVNAANEDKSLKGNLGKFVRFQNLSKTTKDKIINLGIRDIQYVVMESQDCQTETKYALEIIFNGDWHLEFRPCGFDYTVPRGHIKEGFIESWGLDDNWMLWVNNDYIG
jgi:hypothetical protein